MIDTLTYETLGNQRKDMKEAPSMIGVYLFMNKDEIIYVGKATNLKARLISHFESARAVPKEYKIVTEATQIRYTLTDSDFKALLIESELIQRHLPKYNVRWKDGKSYLYIKISTGEEYPKVSTARKEAEKKSRYFGPFPSGFTAQEILKQIRRVIPFCTQKIIGKSQCFYSKIGLCNPCPSSIESQEEPLRTELKRIYRKNIRRLVKILDGDTDAILKDLYKELQSLTKDEKYEEALTLRNKIHRFEYLTTNQVFLRSELLEDASALDKTLILESLLSPYFPELSEIKRIECYDISNFQFKEATASMVVMTDGFLNKSQYRKFRIRNTKASSDFEMLEETIGRRFRNKWDRPDLIVIDGGKPQIRTVLRTLQKLQVQIPVVGLAKRPDRIIIGLGDLPTIRPSMHNTGFNLLRLLRDESHRFARKYHLTLRDAKLLP